MKAFVTSIGEKTTEVCAWLLEKYGFDVYLLGGEEEWFSKYIRFLDLADEDCVRVDADVLVNGTFAKYCRDYSYAEAMTQFHTYDLYRNNLGITCPVLYRQDALRFLRKHRPKLSQTRPETSAWRLLEQHGYPVHTSHVVAGVHGFYQNRSTVKRAEKNKRERGQMNEYDFSLAKKLL